MTFVFLIFAFPEESFAQSNLKKLKQKHKNDLVVMNNGDRNTGEIKKMEFGILYLKSDLVADTLKLDWEKVIRVQSTARYEFETRTNEIHVGMITKDPEEAVPPGELEILKDDGSLVRLKIPEIISVREMGHSILSRINLSLDAGVSFTSANKRTQSNLNFSVSFQKPKYSGTLSAYSQFSGEEGVNKTARHEIQITATRFLKQKWDTVFLAAFLHDNQQDLQLRTTVGGGVQRTFYQSNRTLFYAIAGPVFTNENYFDEAQSDKKNAEFLGALGFSTYRFRGSSLNAVVSTYVSLSDPGRIRIDSNLNWKWDIVSDLYWKISFIDNYDNGPPEFGINHNLNIQSTIGWSF